MLSMANEKEAYRAYDTPVNYNFGQFSIGSQSYDAEINDAFVINGGGETMLNENWILSLGYTSAIIDEEYFNIFDNHFNIGVLYRHNLNHNTDLVLGGSLGYTWSEIETFYDSVKDNDITIGGSIGIRQGITEHLEAGADFALINAYDETLKSFSAQLTYYFNEHIGLGVAGAFSPSTIDSTTFGGHLRFRF